MCESVLVRKVLDRRTSRQHLLVFASSPDLRRARAQKGGSIPRAKSGSGSGNRRQAHLRPVTKMSICCSSMRSIQLAGHGADCDANRRARARGRILNDEHRPPSFLPPCFTHPRLGSASVRALAPPVVGLLASVSSLLAVACSKAPEPPPRFGEVVLSIDTDAPVPAVVNRLRIDVFQEDGKWVEHADIARTNLADWPTSFSLYTRDETTPRRALIRLRGYLEGRLRDYQGERFHERKPYLEPWTATTLSELCTNLPELTLGKDLTLRHGARTLTGSLLAESPYDPVGGQLTCWEQTAGGVVAARLNVAEADEYRIETTDYRALDPNLFIRKDCRDPTTELACNPDIGGGDEYAYNEKAGLVLTLEPGTYTVMAGSYFPAADDITLRADLAANWGAPSEPAEDAPLTGEPRLVVDGVDITPLREPQPLVTIDRLVLIEVQPGTKRLASVVLRTACAGQMAKLSASDGNAAPVALAEAQTCLDTEGVRQPVEADSLVPFEQLSSETLAGTVAPGDSCPRGTTQDRAICVPPGSFVLGTPLYGTNATPERVALMNRYWLDRTEVTVARFRAALARGFQNPSVGPVNNDGPLVEGSVQDEFRHCTYSATPESSGQAREDFPINCVDWFAARAFCRFEGGDLPTEAQWQYAASRAGYDYELDDFCTASSCLAATLTNPISVSDPSGAVDATPLGLLGLYGNVAEWALDSFSPLDSPCWDAATLVDPMCWEQNAPMRTIAGGAWYFAAGTAWRFGSLPSGDIWGNTLTRRAFGLGRSSTGFRCAYGEEPR